MRVWQEPADGLLKGGMGTLPLAGIGAGPREDLPRIIEAIRERLAAEPDRSRAADEWVTTFILLGRRHPRAVVESLLKGVREMEESTTYQAILEKGEVKGVLKGEKALLLRIGRQRLGVPSPEVGDAIEAIADVGRIESLAERIMNVSTWEQLLRS